MCSIDFQWLNEWTQRKVADMHIDFYLALRKWKKSILLKCISALPVSNNRGVLETNSNWIYSFTQCQLYALVYNGVCMELKSNRKVQQKVQRSPHTETLILSFIFCALLNRLAITFQIKFFFDYFVYAILELYSPYTQIMFQAFAHFNNLHP